jgi:hypothetical protein
MILQSIKITTMKHFTILLCVALLASCDSKVDTSETDIEETQIATKTTQEKTSTKIQVLNFATFHMGETSDAKTIEFDEENKQNQEDARKIAELISVFKPTVICVEVPTERNDELNQAYQKYLSAPQTSASYYGEVGLVAFEVGRMNNLDSIFGIDHKLSYNYNIATAIENDIDPKTFDTFQANPFAEIPELNLFEEGISLNEKLRRMNHPKFLDLLITANADMLSYVGTKNGFEGADEAAKYYQRNLRIYSNLNRLKLTNEDRVFILSGGSHTAFLNEFMKRSSKYEVVDTFDYLK